MRAEGRSPLQRIQRRDRRLDRPLAVLAVLALAAFAAWEGVQGRFSTASHSSILAAIAAGLVLALVAGRGRQRKRSRAWARDAARRLRHPRAEWRARAPAVAGTIVWAVVVAATIAWDATSFLDQEHSLPTLSRLFGDVTDHDWGRALVFAAWLVLGLYLAIGWRRPGSEAATRHPGGRPAHPEERRR